MTHTKNDTERLAPPPVRDAYPLPEARAKLGGVSAASIYRWAAQGKIRLTKIGGRTFISAGEIARIAANGA
ncbi:MAG TPA: helix-turn-helix domain-containing protein [Methylocystis sp.]